MHRWARNLKDDSKEPMIGDQLRRLRHERGLSLRALGAQIGVSATLLSQVERGVTDPSLSTVRRIAEAFSESVTALFDNGETRMVAISRPGDRPRIIGSHGAMMYERLTPGNGQLEVLRGVLDPGEVTSEGLWNHTSVECAFVVDGTLTAQVGKRDHRLVVGEAITFDSREPHRYLNLSDGRVEFLIAVTPPSP